MKVLKKFSSKLNYSKFSFKNYKTMTVFQEKEEILKYYKDILNLNVKKGEMENIHQIKEDRVKNYFVNQTTCSNLKNLYGIYNIKSHLSEIIEFIRQKIANSEENSLKELSEYNFNIEGKMVRPLLILLMSKYIYECKSKNSDQDFFETDIYHQYIKPFASCIEVIHNASLLHDDIIDNSFFRRNYKTAHTIYGICPTVFGANYIISKAAGVVSDLNIDHLNEIYSSIVYQLTYGEVKQTLEKPTLNDNSSKESIDNFLQSYMIKTYYKTASLIALSLRGIAIIFNLETELQRSLFNFGLHLGIVFQLIDDLLDIIYDSKQIMKPNFNDLKEGMINSYLLFEIYDNQNDNPLNLNLKKLFEEKKFEEITKILNNGNGIIKSKCLSLDHTYSALSILDHNFFKNNKTKEEILNLIYYLITRKY